MAGKILSLLVAGAVLLSADAAGAQTVRSDQAALAQVAEAAVLELCLSYVTGRAAPPAAFVADLAQDIYDLQPGPFELGRFGRINTAVGQLRIAVFEKEHVCRVAVGDAPVEAVKARLLAVVEAPLSGWRRTGGEAGRGGWSATFTGQDGGARPVRLAIDGFDGPRDSGRGRQLWATVGLNLAE